MVSLHYMLGENMNETFNPDFMKRAIALSRKAAIEEKSGGVFGCVIVKDGKIISEGYISPDQNGSSPGKNASLLCPPTFNT
jgi:hypothetical protein